MNTNYLLTRARAWKKSWLAQAALAVILVLFVLPDPTAHAAWNITAYSNFAVYDQPNGTYMGEWKKDNVYVAIQRFGDSDWVQLRNPDGVNMNPWAKESEMTYQPPAQAAAPAIHSGSMSIGGEANIMGHKYYFKDWPSTYPQIYKDGAEINEWYVIEGRNATLEMTTGEIIRCNWWYQPYDEYTGRNYGASCSINA